MTTKANQELQTAKTTNQTMRNNANITQQDIDYSVKIGKQVIQSKLKEAKAANLEKRKKINKQINGLINRDETEKLLIKAFKETINKDKRITILRATWNMFHDKKIRTNWGLISFNKAYDPVGSIAQPGSYSTKSYERMVKDASFFMDYYMHIGMRDLDAVNHNDDGSEDVDCGWRLEVDIPSKLLPKMTTMLKHLRAMKSLEDLDEMIDNKLNNISDTMEEMEAKLLTQELNRSDRGQEVLNLASGIITDVLGEDINLALEVD